MSSPPGHRVEADGPETRVVRRRYDPERRVVAITGAASFLGSSLARLLEADSRYARVLAIDIRTPTPLAGKARFFHVDLTQPGTAASMATLLHEHRVDTLVHLALLSNPTHDTAWAHELEVLGTLQVLDACAACSLAKVVIRSHSALYGPHADNPNQLGEQRPLRGLHQTPFFADKLEVERLAARFRGENPSTVLTVLRMAPILGREIGNFVSRYLSLPAVPTLMGQDPLIQLLGEHDAVAALKLSLDADFRGAYNIAGDGTLPLSSIVALAGRIPLPMPRMVARVTTNLLWTAQLFDTPPPFLDFLRYICIADTTRSRDEMGFEPRCDIRQIVYEFAEASAAR